MLDKRVKGIIAEGDPRRLRDDERPTRACASSSAAKPNVDTAHGLTMSQKANYFKLGLFVIGAIVAGIIVLADHRLRPLVPAARSRSRPTSTNRCRASTSVRSSRLRGVTIGEVTRISFTYTDYQLGPARSRSARAT